MPKTKTPKINIPPSAREVKNFSLEEAENLVPEIKEFITKTGTPYLWRGHTHTKPPKGAPVIYLGEYGLPKSHHNPDRWSPCPCCVPEHPKYFKKGRIAYFPDEDVIRCMGDDCFRTLNPKGHEDAIEIWTKRKKRLSQISFLLDNLDILVPAQNAIKHAIEIAERVDQFRASLSHNILDEIKRKLWKAIRDGVLHTRIEKVITVVGRDGRSRHKTEYRRERYASITGHNMLNPKQHNLAPRLKLALQMLQSITIRSDMKSIIELMDDSERESIVKTFAEGLDKARRATEELAELREYFQPITVNTMKRWGALHKTEMYISVERSDQAYFIGRNENHLIKIPLVFPIDEPLRQIPRIGKGLAEKDLLKGVA